MKIETTRKKVLIVLRMAGIAGQDKLAGIFRYLSQGNHTSQAVNFDCKSKISNFKSENSIPQSEVCSVSGNHSISQSEICSARSNQPVSQSEICNLKSEIVPSDWDLTLIRTAAEFTPARLKAALSSHYDGFIVSIPDVEPTTTLLARSDIPTVVLDIHDEALSARTKNIAFISNSAEEIGAAAADFLLSTGRCRSYAFIHNPTVQTWSRDRGRTFIHKPTVQTWSRDRGRTFIHKPAVQTWSRDRCRVFRETLRDRGLWCHELAEPSELATLPRPIGILAANDDRGYDTLEWCRSHRIRVPEDALVLGINNDTLICENCRPRLSSIQPDFEAEGFLAAQVLSHMMAAAPQKNRHSRKISNGKFHISDCSTHFTEPSSPSETFGSTRSVRRTETQGHSSQSEICNLKSEISPPKLFVGVKTIVRRDSTAEISPAGKLVQKAVAYVRAHALEGISVTDVVRHLGCSRRLADLRFRELQETSIGEMIIACRLDEVRLRLETTGEPIDSIARACGYENPTSLKNLFKRRFGMSMRDYRALHRVSTMR